MSCYLTSHNNPSLRLFPLPPSQSNFLSGKVPISLATLPELSNLILSHNRLSETIPSPSISSLVCLELKYNLSGQIPPLPSSIQYISLSSNLLSWHIPVSLQPLPRLAHHDVSFNRLSGSILASIFTLPLETLKLQRNTLSGPVEPATEVTVRTADLSYNMMWGTISPRLAGVRRLYLNSNRFWGEVPAELARMVAHGRMEVMYLQHNFLTGATRFATISLASSVCMEYNCMVVLVVDACPASSGSSKARPAEQCYWRRRSRQQRKERRGRRKTGRRKRRAPPADRLRAPPADRN